MIIDLFAGPGGWDEGLRVLGVTDVLGVEWDESACASAEAAGHKRLRADIAAMKVLDALMLIASPPCTKFSAAGSGVGTRVMDHLAAGIRAIFAGQNPAEVIESVRTAILPTCLAEREAANLKRRKPWPAEKVAAKAAEDAFTTALVLEPCRWIMGMESVRTVALEQVPQVLPLWDVYAECLRGLGWSVWTGVLNAADFGVPQTRRRAILIASLDRKVARPEPTHAEFPIPTLFGEALGWVTMAEALGWGFDEPSATVSSGGAATGGAEPFGNAGYRKRLAAIVTNQRTSATGEYYERSVDEPAPTLTTNTRLWNFHEGWGFTDRPAPTLCAGSHGKQSGAEWGGSSVREAMLSAQGTSSWADKRPATTVVGSFRPDIIASPGHHDTSRQNAPDSIRVTVQEAAILQSFPPDYPWQGSRTKQYEQGGKRHPAPARRARHRNRSRVGLPTGACRMTCIPPFEACTIGREGHYCHQPLGHRGDHQCDHRSWPMDLETEIAAQLYIDFYAVYYLDAPEYPPPGAIAAAVQPQGSAWRRMARRAIERAGGGL